MLSKDVNLPQALIYSSERPKFWRLPLQPNCTDDLIEAVKASIHHVKQANDPLDTYCKTKEPLKLSLHQMGVLTTLI